MVTRLFLRLHGMDFTAEAVERVLIFEQLGKGALSADEFTRWVKNNDI